MDALIYRYGLPGLPVSIGIYFIASYYLDIRNADVIGIPVVIALSLLLGYFLHQIWMFFFEQLNNFRYDSPKRAALRKIAEQVNKSKSKQIKQAFQNKNLYNVWDTFLYSDEMPIELRKKDRGMWNSYHTNMGNAIGLLVGFIVFLLAFVLNPDLRQPLVLPWFGFMLIFLFVAPIVLCLKARQTRKLAENIEVFWVETFFKDFAKSLAKGKVRLKSK